MNKGVFMLGGRVDFAKRLQPFGFSLEAGPDCNFNGIILQITSLRIITLNVIVLHQIDAEGWQTFLWEVYGKSEP